MKDKIIEILSLMLDELVQATIIGSKAIFILIFGIWLAYFVAGRVKKILLKTLKDEMLSSFLAKVAFAAIMILAIIVTLGTMGVQTTSIIAALGAAGLAIALALKDSLSNLASGIMLVVFRPFTKNDMIEVGKNTGYVQDISLFHTFLKTFDGKLVVIPNTNIANSEIINYTVKAAKEESNEKAIIKPQEEVVRRIDWKVGVGYGSDTAAVKGILMDAVLSTENIDNGAENPKRKIFIGVNELNDSSVEFIIKAWIIDNDKYSSTRCAMIENVKNALDSHNIEIPFNKLDVNILK